MRTLKFKNGDELPAIGLGTWKSEPGEVYDAVIAAVKAGYRHIDCAPIYGNEAEVGEALQKVMADGLPYLQQRSLFDFCEKQGLHMTAYSPLGSRDRPERLQKEGDPDLFENPTIKDIADKHGCTPAQVLISWAVHRGTAVIPKSVTPSRIKENLQSADIGLSAEEMNRIAKLEKGYRFLDGGIWVMEGSPYSRADLWEEVLVENS